jgi:hypothetical protein
MDARLRFSLEAGVQSTTSGGGYMDDRMLRVFKT